MKDITHYFVDAAKASEAAAVNPVEKPGQETEPENTVRPKRNRVKIKISRRSTDERVCKIIDSNNDMIDKTPSPFAKVNNPSKLPRDETPKSRSLSKPFSESARRRAHKSENPDKQQILAEVNLNHAAAENNDSVDTKRRKARNNGNHGDTVKDNRDTSNPKSQAAKEKVGRKSSAKDTKEYERETSNEVVCLADEIPTSGGSIISVIDLTDELNEESDGHCEESDAFQILMNRSKPACSVSPVDTSSQDIDLSVKKSEEYKEKLKRSKEKLMVLADKKGYTKRKLEELEEGERIERNIENRIKAFTNEGKKDSGSATPLVQTNQKQPSSSLLNYFSKTSLDLSQKNSADMSTFVVKADVHVSEGLLVNTLREIPISNKVRPMRKHRTQSVDFSEVDNIKVIASEEICPTNIVKKDQYTVQQRKKCRWSLRIKLQESDGEKHPLGESSDEELFSLKTKSKSSTEGDTEMDSQHKNSSRKNMKQFNGPSRLKLKTKDQVTDLQNQPHDIFTLDSNQATNFASKTVFHSPKIEYNGEYSLTRANSENISAVKKNEEIYTSVSENNFKRKSTEKLAPLFTKRRKPDPETIAARRLFLQPDITDNNQKSADRKVTACSILPFPSISHVTQLNNSSSNASISLRIPMKVESPYVPVLRQSNYKHVIDLSKSKLKPQERVNKLDAHNIQEIVSDMEERCVGARKMWDTISLIVKGQSPKKASPKARPKRGRLSNKKEPLTEYQNEGMLEQNSIWTYKYKPTSTQEVVGNEEAAKKLRDWLDGWRSTLTNENGSSGDEFYSSDCSYSSSNENNQVAVLLGPHGSGKSASVYAVAEELGYTVLEVNASTRRTGKKLLKELEEATKSHRIKKNKGVPLFKPVSKEVVTRKIPQNSLILLEDIDIIFEEDEGFISATYQLASNTKRPIVMTCRDMCPHLSKMAPQQNKIYFQNPTGSRVSALLELISLAETGYRLSHGCAAELLQAGDLRKALLQLQYLLLSGPPKLSEQSRCIRNSLWQDMRYCVYKPAIKVNKKRKAKKTTNSETITNNTIDVLDSVATQLDNVALISSLVDIEDPAINLSHVKAQLSLSLTEDDAPYSISHSISSDIAEWIGKRAICRDQLYEQDTTQYRKSIALKKQLNKGVDLALSHVTSFLLDSRIMSVDYLPSARAICRAEDSRSSTNSKRGNRFFHYLHGLKVPATSLRPNILTAACKAMQEKAEEDTHESTSSAFTL